MRAFQRWALGPAVLLGCSSEPLAPGDVDFVGTWAISAVSTFVTPSNTQPVVSGADRCETEDVIVTIGERDGALWRGHLGPDGRVVCEADGEVLSEFALFPNVAIELTHDANGVRIVTAVNQMFLFLAGQVERENRIGIS